MSTKPKQPAHGDAKRPNTLGLREGQLHHFLDSLDSIEGEGSQRREFVRWSFRKQTVVMRVSQPAGAEVLLRVACRNLSRGGMSVLHNAYLHPGSRCAIAIPHPDQSKKFVKVSGMVVRSTHRAGAIHEVGIKFDEPVDPTEFMEKDDFTDYYSLESVSPDQLKGCILHIDDSELDQKIVAHYLRDSNLRIRPADSVESGLAIAPEGVDLILCDFHLTDGTGDEFIAKLREAGIDTPVVVVTSDTSSETRKRMMDMQCDGFLAKPLNQELLLRAIGEFLLVRNNATALQSTLPDGDPAKEMVASFVKDLHSYAERLESCVERKDAESAKAIALQIKGSAPSLGFGMIADLASKAAEAITKSGSVGEAIVPMRGLISAAERARAD